MTRRPTLIGLSQRFAAIMAVVILALAIGGAIVLGVIVPAYQGLAGMWGW